MFTEGRGEWLRQCRVSCCWRKGRPPNHHFSATRHWLVPVACERKAAQQHTRRLGCACIRLSPFSLQQWPLLCCGPVLPLTQAHTGLGSGKRQGYKACVWGYVCSPHVLQLGVCRAHSPSINGPAGAVENAAKHITGHGCLQHLQQVATAAAPTTGRPAASRCNTRLPRRKPSCNRSGSNGDPTANAWGAATSQGLMAVFLTHV